MSTSGCAIGTPSWTFAVHAGGDERREGAREARHRHLEDDRPDLRDLELEAVPLLAAPVCLLPPTEPDDRAGDAREDDVEAVLEQVGDGHDVLRELREVSAELREDVHEDRDEKEQQAGQHERGERQHHQRIEHRALDAALDLRRLLDVHRDPVEDLVEDAGRLARLDHRDEQPFEDLRVARHRLREEEASLDIRAQLTND